MSQNVPSPPTHFWRTRGRRRSYEFGGGFDGTFAEWLAAAKADAEQRGLPELIPMLDGLAQATERLRAADWNDDAGKDPFEVGTDDDHDQ